MKKKTLTRRKILALSLLLVLCAALIAVSVMQAIKLDRMHRQMRSFVDRVPAERLDQVKSRYPAGFTLYYTLNSYSAIYAWNKLDDPYYEKLKMGRWTVEADFDSSQSIRIYVPEISWNPQYVDLNMGGWLMDGQIGSSITLDNPRLDPDELGRLWLEVIDRNEQGVVFVIGQGRDDKPRNVL